MSILLNENSRVLVCGITGCQGAFHTEQMLSYGTRVVAGVTPSKSGQSVHGVPVFDTAAEAVRATGADASIIFVPARAAAESILENLDAGVSLIVCITEGIPVLDMMRVKRRMAGSGAVLIGPNCPGIISAGESKLGIMPNMIHQKGCIGVVSRSGTLTYEAVNQLSRLGLGETSVVGIGGDPIRGIGFLDVVKRFESDPETKGIVMIGEIGAGGEEEAAEWIRDHGTKPVVGFVAGSTAPKGRRMGHAGAIVSSADGTAEAKKEKMRECRIAVSELLDDIGATMQKVL